MWHKNKAFQISTCSLLLTICLIFPVFLARAMNYKIPGSFFSVFYDCSLVLSLLFYVVSLIAIGLMFVLTFFPKVSPGNWTRRFNLAIYCMAATFCFVCINRWTFAELSLRDESSQRFVHSRKNINSSRTYDTMYSQSSATIYTNLVPWDEAKRVEGAESFIQDQQNGTVYMISMLGISIVPKEEIANINGEITVYSQVFIKPPEEDFDQESVN